MRREGILVALAGPLHELGLHRISGWGGPSGRVTEYGAGRGGNVQRTRPELAEYRRDGVIARSISTLAQDQGFVRKFGAQIWSC